MTTDECLFPSPAEVRVHRRARTLQRKANEQIESRANEIKTPEELVDFILEIATKRYKSGQQHMEFTIGVPPDNFKEWANKNRIGSPDWDQLDRKTVKNEVARRAKKLLEKRTREKVYVVVQTGCANVSLLSFIVQVTVRVRWTPSTPLSAQTPRSGAGGVFTFLI